MELDANPEAPDGQGRTPASPAMGAFSGIVEGVAILGVDRLLSRRRVEEDVLNGGSGAVGDASGGAGAVPLASGTCWSRRRGRATPLAGVVRRWGHEVTLFSPPREREGGQRTEPHGPH